MKTPHILHSFTLATTLLTGAVAAQTASVTPPVRVNTTGANLSGNNQIDGATVVSAGGGVFHAAWIDQFGTTSGTQDVYFASSDDNGVTWTTPVRVDTGDMPNEHDSDEVSLALTANGTLVAIWEEARDAAANGSGNEDLFYNRSTDGGVTWMPAAMPLNTATAGAHITSDIDRAWIAADGDSLHVTWEEDTVAGLGGSEDCWYVRSTDAGATWSAPVMLSANPGAADVDDPKVVAAGGVVIAVWVEPDAAGAGTSDDIVIARSTDGGATFAAPTVIESDPSGDVDDTYPAIDGSLVGITYNENFSGDPGGEGVYSVVSQDGGATWLAEVECSVQMYQVTSADADSPHIAVNGDDVFVVYDEDSQDRVNGGSGGSGGNAVYLAYSNDRGASWTVDVPIDGGLVANRPKVVANDDAVVVYFERDANGSNTPRFQWSVDRGASFSAPAAVVGAGPDVDEGNSINESTYLAIDAETNAAVVLFHDNAPTGANEVYAASLFVDVPLGASFCTSPANSTGAPGVLAVRGNELVSLNSLTLAATSVPPSSFGFFLTSTTQDNVPNVQGGAGTLCLGGDIGRGVGNQVFLTDAAGTAETAADLGALPQPMGTIAAMAGETWNFQFWHRDSDGAGGATSNLTSAVAVPLR